MGGAGLNVVLRSPDSSMSWTISAIALPVQGAELLGVMVADQVVQHLQLMLGSCYYFERGVGQES